MANHQSMVNHKLSHSLQPIPSPAAPRRAIARRSWSDRCLPWRLTVPCSSGSSNSKWMVYNGKNRKKWMITRSTPIFYGNLQINVKSKYIDNQQNRCISTLMGLTFPHFLVLIKKTVYAPIKCGNVSHNTTTKLLSQNEAHPSFVTEENHLSFEFQDKPVNK